VRLRRQRGKWRRRPRRKLRGKELWRRKRRTIEYLQRLRDEVLEEEVGKEESRDDMEGSKDGPGESQEKGTPLSTSC